MEDAKDALGEAIDRLDSCATMLQSPLSSDLHVKCLRATLPEIVKDLKDGFYGVTGENPWA